MNADIHPLATRVCLPAAFRDKWFSERFYSTIQSPIRGRAKNLEVDMSECGWADPIPLLALLCELHGWVAALIADGHQPSLTIDLGRARTISSDGESPPRFRLYLAKHGFLKAICETCPAVCFRYESALAGEWTEFDAAQLDSLLEVLERTSPDQLYYDERPACRPRFIQIPVNRSAPSREVEDFVDDLVQSMDDELFRGRSTQFSNRDSALQRLRQVALEVVANGWEHAYESEQSGVVCVYARIRTPSDRKRSNENDDQCPLIRIIHEVSANRYVELFICDVGKGLVADASKWRQETSDEDTQRELDSFATQVAEGGARYPLRQLAKLIFRRPVSRHARRGAMSVPARSNVTGLLHVNNVLSHHSDRSRILVGNEWLAGPHPREDDYTGGPGQGFNRSVDPIGGSKPPEGTFFHFAIEISAVERELDLNWLSASNSTRSSFLTLRAGLEPGAVDDQLPLVFDVRSLLEGSGDANMNYKPDNKTILGLASTHFGQNGISIVRVSRNFQKGLSDSLVQAWANSVGQSTRAATLVFCDLSQMQAILLQEHLKKLSFDVRAESDRPNLDVLIISEELDACRLAMRSAAAERVWYHPPQRRTGFVEHPGGPPEAQEIVTVLRALRQHDSGLYWTRVSLISKQMDLLKPDVAWSMPDGTTTPTGVRLPTYLDYGLAAQDRVLAKVLRRSLRRAVAAFPELSAIAVDDLVAPDLADAQRWAKNIRLDEPDSSDRLFVVSAIVTGSTTRQAEKRYGKPAAVLCCFLVETLPPRIHNSNTFAALNWSPPEVRPQMPKLTWQRIPGTPYITPVGMFRRIPRMLAQDFSNALHRPTPEESYRDWHRGQLMRVGHWTIDRRHGLIEIDHARALQQSAESRTGFYQWIAEELVTRAESHPHPMIVYPAGRLGAILVRHLLYKVPRFAEHASKWRVFPLRFLPDLGDGFRTLAPLSLEHISASIKEFGVGPSFFIDVGFVGNRTFRHTKRQLSVLGVSGLVGVGLLNRTSYPALYAEIAKGEEVVSYWRVDVPTLNDERSCPLCRGEVALSVLRERVRVFQPGLLSTIETIARDWRPSDPNLSWWDHGLEPKRLARPIRKKFSFVPKGSQAFTKEKVSSLTGQAGLLTEGGEPIPAPSIEPQMYNANEIEWSHVWLQSSTHAAIYAMELARTTTQSEYPWRLARELGASKNPEAGSGSCRNFLASLRRRSNDFFKRGRRATPARAAI